MNARRALVVPVVAVILVCGCSSADWPMFRQNALRTAAQVKASPLSDWKKVRTLEIGWRFPAGDDNLCGGFTASPVVYKGRIFIGNGNGYFYALCAKTGQKLWQYPEPCAVETCEPGEECRPLKSKFLCNKSSLGIASSATIAKIGGRDAVIFAAPDPCSNEGFGDGRLFALDLRTGKKIWKSQVIARLSGCRKHCKDELHENLGHSSPLVLGDKVYVGVGDHCDNPVQKGRVAAVKLETGDLVSAFRYCSTKMTADPYAPCDDPTDTTRGGGVWSPPAGWKDSIYITTGNTRSGDKDQPRTNHGLSLLRLDAATGRILWSFQPVPWELDADPDWAAAPTIMSTRCGQVIISTQKDGWTHAVKASDGTQLWSYPRQETLPFQCGEGEHGDSTYMRSGAAWEDVYVTMNGGLDMKPGDVTGGYRRLHAFNVCAPEPDRLRWLIDIKDVSANCACPQESCTGRCLGNPTITRGIVYVGTNTGHLLAIADPAIASDAGLRCENPDVASEDCERLGYRLVRQPKILANVPLKGSMAYTEPALANGRVYVSTDDTAQGQGGYVYMLQPKKR